MGPLAPGLEWLAYGIERLLAIADTHECLSGLEMRDGRFEVAVNFTAEARGMRLGAHFLEALLRAHNQEWLYAAREEPTAKSATTVEMDAEPGGGVT